jgi:hypothetical protein
MCTKTTIVQKLPHEYETKITESNALDGNEDDILDEESDTSSENNCEDVLSGSDDDFLGFYVE